MTIIRATVGDQLKEFDDNSTIDDVWKFLDSHLSNADVEKGIVLMDDSGNTIGQIWEQSQYYAFWETPSAMQSYFQLIGFDQGE